MKDKALKDEKRKEEDSKRVKYICKDGDTVQSIALKQLRDSRVAALIYQINKDVIPTKIVNGESIPTLHAGLIIWLPSPKETREFRTKLMGGGATGIEAKGEKQYESVEDELAAKFGANWSGGNGEAGGAPDESTTPGAAPANSIERKLMEDAMVEAKRRRENIEKALGPIASSSKTQNRAPGGQILYQVRLGDTLRSVASKHPALGDVNLWRLLAEVNQLSVEVDAKGQPTAGLARGSKIKIPTIAEVAEYRQRIGSMAGQPMAKEQRVSKTCRDCGRMNVASATLCPCGYEFDADKQEATTAPAASKDAATMILEAISNKKHDEMRTEDLDRVLPPQPELAAQGTPTTDAENADETEDRDSQEHTKEVAALVEPEEVWASFKEFETSCRLAKSAHSWDSANGKLVIQLQLHEPDKGWYAILEYDIFATHSIRHSFTRGSGARKSVKIDLPAPAAMELAQNDLLANWNNYKQKYFA